MELSPIYNVRLTYREMLVGCAIYFWKGNLEVLKKAIFSGIVFCSILLVGCNTTEVLESEQEIVFSQTNGGG